MKPNDWNAYRSSSQPSVHTAPVTAITSPSISETLSVATTALQQNGSGLNSSTTPEAESLREWNGALSGWRGFSDYEILYGIRAAGGL